MMAAYTGALALLGLPILSLILLDRASPWKNIELAAKRFEYFVFGAVLSTWFSALLRSGVSDQ